MNGKDTKVVVFDLDGTLYADTDHFDYHTSLLRSRLPDERKAAFDQDYNDMIQGHHTLRIGTAYDTKRDVVIQVDPLSFKAVGVQTWNGKAWMDSDVLDVYPDPLVFDFEEIVAIGDGWWFPFANAIHHGLTTKDTYECYVQTKAFMVSGDFQLTKIPGLREYLLRLKEECVLVLMTNSEAYDVENLLTELDLQGIFHDLIPSALKPGRTKEHFQAIMEKWSAKPHEVWSIGDNYINEIAPALQLGMNATLISPTTPISNLWKEEKATY